MARQADRSFVSKLPKRKKNRGAAASIDPNSTLFGIRGARGSGNRERDEKNHAIRYTYRMLAEKETERERGGGGRVVSALVEARVANARESPNGQLREDREPLMRF